MKKDKKSKKILIIIIAIAVILDQITKVVAYIKGWNADYEFSENNGYYIIMSILIIIMIIRYLSNDNTFIKRGTKILLSFAIAGAIGNLIDRIWFKNVIVFINLSNSFNINLAYIYIVIAWVGMAAVLSKNTTKFINDRKNRNKKMKG